MTDSWNDKPGSSPHDKAMSYNAAQVVDDFSQDYARMYESGVDIFQASLFWLERSPVGSHCGHDVYVKSRPRPVKGISYPAWFKVLRLIETEEDDSQLSAALLKSPSATTEIQQFWSPLTQPVSGQKSTPLQGYVDRLLRIDDNSRKQNESLPYALGIQVTNFTEQVAKTNKAPRAHLPPREWFDERVQQLKFTDIFTLWPGPEARMLQLILGRAWLGRSNSQLVGEDKVLEHTFRSVGIIVGEDAGLGKSTIFDKLARATNMAGYRWSNFRNIAEQFGIGEVAMSDVAYKDDVTGATLADLIKSENTKIIASGGRLYVENKFQKGVSVHSRCVLLANTNEWNPRLAYAIDPGTVDRVKLLTTYRRSELDKECKARSTDFVAESPNFAPFVHVPWLANKLDVSEECLMLWACRLAVDEFHKLTFWHGDVPTERLRLEVHDISSRLRYSFNKDCTRALISGMLLAHTLCNHLPQRYIGEGPYEMRELNATVLREVFASFRCLVTDKGMYRLRSLIKLHWEQNGRPDTHPWSGIRKLNFLSVKEAETALNNAIASRASLDDQVKALFGSLRLRDGFKGSSDIVWVTAAWQACSGYIAEIEALARILDSQIMLNRNGVLADVSKSMGKAAKGMTEDGWLESSDYTPGSVENQLSDQEANFDETDFAEAIAKATWQC